MTFEAWGAFEFDSGFFSNKLDTVNPEILRLVYG